jgi:mannosyltransferase OCH1-like enzyme
MQSEIPKKIHITNKEKTEIHEFILSRWQHLHPDFEIFFYTDEDNDAFVRKHFKQYQKTYERLNSICKIDFIRLLYLYKEGGIYADMDVLPLKSFHPLLTVSPVVLCKEDHFTSSIHEKEYIISNSLILSTPKNPCIKTLIDAIVKKVKDHDDEEPQDPLYLTGPFLFNEIYEKQYKEDIHVTLLESYFFNPYHFYHFMNNHNNNMVRDLSMTFSIHLCQGSWWQKEVYFNQTMLEGFMKSHDESKKQLSKISCLCVTKNHSDLLDRAIQCFLDQIYENKELIVIYESNNQTIHETMAKNPKPNPNLFFYEIPIFPKQSLGELRNISLEKATGDYICQWDDDDWYSPMRLVDQYYQIKATQSHGCILPSIYIMDKMENKLYRSCQRMWEGTIVYEKGKIKAKYEALNKGEDTLFTQSLDYISVLIKPELYVYHVHNNNTHHYQHMKEIMDVSTLSVNGSLREKMNAF